MVIVAILFFNSNIYWELFCAWGWCEFINFKKNQVMKRVVLITGASSGFGFEVAQRLLGMGERYIVYVAARRVELMSPLVERGAVALAMDVTSDESVDRAVGQVLQEQGRIDVVFCNAGFGSYGAVEDVPMDRARYQFEVNVFGVARTFRAVLPTMRAQRSGLIINTSSVVGEMSSAGCGWYAATKHAVEALSVALRQEVRGLGIKVVMIKPGPVKTGFEQVMLSNIDSVDTSPDYRELMSGFRQFNLEMYAHAPSPEGTVKAVINAIESHRPKLKYRTTFMAKAMPRMIRLLGGRLSDAMTLSMTFRAARRG